MPTTIKSIFDEFKILHFKQVKWGNSFKEKKSGIYIVSSSPDPDQHLGISEKPYFDDEKIKKWIRTVPDFQIDNTPINSKYLKQRLSKFWLPDESILYIGKAPKRSNGTGISKRVSEYYSTPIGKGSPHSGGQWLKVLKNIDAFTVYYGVCESPALIEYEMLNFFMNNVSTFTRLKLWDKNFPLPFANIRNKGDKKHGLKNQRL